MVMSSAERAKRCRDKKRERWVKVELYVLPENKAYLKGLEKELRESKR